MPPTLTVFAPSKIHILAPDYSVEAETYDESGISHVIFNVLPNKNFIEKMWVQVDIDNHIAEFNEENNIALFP